MPSFFLPFIWNGWEAVNLKVARMRLLLPVIAMFVGNTVGIMSKAVVPQENLEQIFSSLSKSQREYLCLRLCDFPISEAMRIAQVKATSVDRWERDDGFKALEERVLAKKIAYREQAIGIYWGSVGLKAIKSLSDLADKAVEWDKLDRFDKPYVMQALMLFSRVGKSRSEDKSYDEMILKRHRVLE